MIRYLTAGESHGPELTAILDGFPAGLVIDHDQLNHELARRQIGFGSGGRMKIEKDKALFTSGLIKGKTTGAPITFHIKNKDWENWKDKDIDPLTIPRPGHADLTAALKYNYDDFRISLERASARETAARTAVGALCKQFLNEFHITVGSYVSSIGPISLSPQDNPNYFERFRVADENDIRCPDPEVYPEMHHAISECMKKQDTLGGVIDVVALGLPPGLGSHVQFDRRLDAQLMGLMGSIPSIKGVEIGHAFEMSTRYGSDVHDEIDISDNLSLKRTSNRAGGLEGGISTGEPIVMRLAMKPISTVMKGLKSIDIATGKKTTTQYERSDFCAVPRATIVAEAVLAYGLSNALIEKIGGDYLEEMKERFSKLKKNRLNDLSLDNQAWKFDY